MRVISVIIICFLVVTSYKTIDPFDRGYRTQDFFGYQLLTIGSNSMYPTINVGDSVLVKVVKDDTDIIEGDIIAYQLGEHVIVHRVKEVVGYDSYVTKGDNNNTDDGSPIPRDKVLAKSVKVFGGLGDSFRVMKTMPGRILFIVLILGLLCFMDSIFRFPDVYFGYAEEDEDDEE